MKQLKNTLLKFVLCFILVATAILPVNAQLSENVTNNNQDKSGNSITEVIKQNKKRIAVIRSVGNFVKLVSALADFHLLDLPKIAAANIIMGGILAGRRINHPEIKQHFRKCF